MNQLASDSSSKLARQSGKASSKLRASTPFASRLRKKRNAADEIEKNDVKKAKSDQSIGSSEMRDGLREVECGSDNLAWVQVNRRSEVEHLIESSLPVGGRPQHGSDIGVHDIDGLFAHMENGLMGEDEE